MFKQEQRNHQHNPQPNFNARTLDLASDQHSSHRSDRKFVARIEQGMQRVSELAMRLRATPLATLAVPVALTLLVAVAAGTVHPYPTCPGWTPCGPINA